MDAVELCVCFGPFGLPWEAAEQMGSLTGVPVAGDPQGAAVQVLCCRTRPAGPAVGRKGDDNTQGRGSQKRKREALNGKTAAAICV